MKQMTKNKLFGGIICLGFVTNLVVVFDIQYVYLRAFFSLVSLATIPGLLIILMFKVRHIGFWDYFVYTIGLSIAFLMFAGLAVNWALPWLHITDTPLSLPPLLTSLDICLSVFGVIAYRRNETISVQIELPKLNWSNNICFAFPIVFAILSIAGATTLNNGGPNYLTMVMLGGMAAYVFIVVRFRDRLNENIYPWAILMISLSLLLMYSLRSWYISGWDNHLEFYVFHLTKIRQYWSTTNFSDPYNACLSITILPSVLSVFSQLGDELLMKIVYSLFFSFAPVVLYLTSKRYVSPPLAYLASFFFVSQWMFMNQYPFLAREQIALVFLSLMIYTLFNSKLQLSDKHLLLYVFSFSMVVSHYSTTYLAVFALVISYVLISVVKALSKVKSLFVRDYITITNLNLSGRYILILVGLTLFWNVRITNSASNVTAFVKDNIATINLSVFEPKNNDTNWNLWKIGITDKDIENNLDQYVIQATVAAQSSSNGTGLFSPQIYDRYQTILKPKTYPGAVNATIWSLMHYLLLVITISALIFILGGLLTFLLHINSNIIDQEYIVLACIYAALLGLSLIIPLGSHSIGPYRMFQQALILLALSCSIGAKSLFGKIHQKRYLEYVSLILIAYFLFYSTFVQEIVRGEPLTAQSYNLANRGLYYDLFYTQGSEVKSAEWLSSNRKEGDNVFADSVAYLRLVSHGAITDVKVDVLPSTIDKESYVYLDYNNKVNETGYAIYLDKYSMNYSYPIEFLDDNKNLIYNDGGSEIFK